MLINELEKYLPKDDFEISDKKIMLDAYVVFKEELLNRLPFFHFTVSAIIFNDDLTKVLFMYHNIYDSYAWVGGHMDGSNNLKETLFKEVYEETGLKNPKFIKEEPISIEILPVFRHFKNGQVVSSHEHYNITYSLTASEEEKLVNNSSESKALKWIKITELEKYVKEEKMLPIYNKIIERTIK